MAPAGPHPEETCPLQSTAVISNVPLLNSVGHFPTNSFYLSETKESFPPRTGKTIIESHPVDSCCLPDDTKNLQEWAASVSHKDYEQKCGPPAKARFNQSSFYKTQFKLGNDESSSAEFETETQLSYPCRSVLPKRAKHVRTHSSVNFSDGHNILSPHSHYQENYKAVQGHSPTKLAEWLKGVSPPIMKEERLCPSRKSEMTDSYPLWETHPMIMGKAPIGDTGIIPKVHVDLVNNSLHRDSYKTCNPSIKTKGFREKHHGTIVLGDERDLSCWSVSTLDAIHPTLKTYAKETISRKKPPPPRSPAHVHPFRECAVSSTHSTYKPHYQIPETVDSNKYRQSNINLCDVEHVPFATTHHQRTFTKQPTRDCFPQVRYPPWNMGDPAYPEQKSSEMKTTYKRHSGPGSAVNPIAAKELKASHIRLFDVGKWLGNTTYKAHFTHDGAKDVSRNDTSNNYEYRIHVPYFTQPHVISPTPKVTIGIDDHTPLDFTRTITLGPYKGCVGEKPQHDPILNRIDKDKKLYCKVSNNTC